MDKIMQATVGDLRAAVAAVKPLASGKHVPILGFLAIGNGAIRATDTEVFATATVATEGQDTGETLIDAALLHKFLSGLPAGDLATVWANDETARVEAGGEAMTVKPLSIADFPQWPALNCAGDALLFPDDELCDVLSTCLHSCSTEETRHYLRGVYVGNGYGTGIDFVSTDGHRLTMIRVKDTEKNPDSIIPLDAVKFATRNAKMLRNAKIGFDRDAHDRKFVQIESDKMQIVARCINAEFPTYTKVVPQHDDTTRVVVTNAKSGAASAKRIAAMGAKPVVIDTFGGEYIGETSEASVSSKASFEIVRPGTANNNHIYAVAPEYLRDAMNVIGKLSENVMIYLDGSGAKDHPTQNGAPIVFMPGQKPSFGPTKIIIMPMRR